MSGSAWSVSGAVLAGGHSRRMGRDKAFLESEGQPLWRSRLGVLQSWGAAPVSIVCRADQPVFDPDIPQVRDTAAGAGPLAGLHAGLRVCRTNWLAVLAVDMPRIDAGWFAWLGGFCRPGVGALARHCDGFEPLAAIYPREALPEVERRLRRGERRLHDLARALAAQGRLRAVPLSAAGRHRVMNWNHPEEVERVVPNALSDVGHISTRKRIEGNALHPDPSDAKVCNSGEQP